MDSEEDLRILGRIAEDLQIGAYSAEALAEEAQKLGAEYPQVSMIIIALWEKLKTLVDEVDNYKEFIPEYSDPSMAPPDN